MPKMRSLCKILGLALLLSQTAHAQSTADLRPVPAWGNGPSFGLRWSLNASETGAWIAYSSTTLSVPGPVQQLGNTGGALGFYPAMTDSNGDIIQSIVATFAQEGSNG